MREIPCRRLVIEAMKRRCPSGRACMSTDREPPTSAPDTGDADRNFGLTVAIALIMGSIIGVGIFNLPTSLASYGPITLVSMGLTTIGAIALALMFAALSR